MLLLTAVAAQPARVHELLLPSPVRMTGIVVDTEQRPVSDAWVWHHNNRTAVRTDREGRFEFQTDAPAIVLRKPGFNGVFVRSEPRTDLRITMQRADRRLRKCVKADRCASVSGFSARICVPFVSGVTATKQSNDVDYGARGYVIESTSGKKVSVMHGAGPMWSLGAPSDDRVWGSLEYSEQTYQTGTIDVIDARGEMRDGKVWRFVGLIGESLEYRNVERSDAAKLDKLLNGICVIPRNP